MKNLYLRMKTAFLIAAMLVVVQAGFAQVDLTWNGSISSDASVSQNWTPEGTMADNNLIIGNAGTYTNACVITGTEDIDVNIFNNSTASSVVETDETTGEVTSWTPAGEVTINMSEGATFRINGSANSAGDYIRGILNVNGGNFHYNKNKNFYCDNDSLVINFDCDTVTFKHWVGLGDRNGTKGGRINITGNTLVTMNYLDRIPTGLGRVHLFIGGESEVRASGDIVDWVNERITAGSIATDEDKDLVVKYDALTLKTYITTRLKTAFEIEPTDKQLLVAGEVGSEVTVVQNDGYALMTGGVEWVYGTVDGTYDQSFSPAETGTSIIPLFAEAGTYYLALKGIDASAATHYTNSVECVVSSNKAVLSNDVTQNLRLGQAAKMVEVLEETVATSREWKYRTAEGDFMSFDPAITGVEFSANFTEVGTYFVICESLIDGVVNKTKELQFNITTWNSVALNLTFTGVNSKDGRDIFNWDPAAYIHKNNLSIGEGDTVTINGFNKDTIPSIWLELDALVHLTGSSTTDTLWYRSTGEWNDPGSWLISKGVFVFPTSYFRMYEETQTFTLENDAKAVFDGTVLLGGSDNPAVGANIVIKDDAIALFNVWPGRISANEGYSEFRMEGNAQYQFAGDARGTVAPWITGTKDETTGEYTFYPKFITPAGTEPYMVYDENTDITTVAIRELSAFGIEQTKTQIVGKSQLTNALTLVNAGTYTSFEWKYSTSMTGPWESFSPIITGETAQVSFDVAGTYYVVCEGNGAMISSNSVPVKVVDIAVAPAGDQYLAVGSYGDDADELSVTLPDGATGVQWKYATVSGGPYSEFLIPETQSTYIPWDIDEGTHYLVYAATVQDDDGQDVEVISNEVTIYVGATAIGDKKALQLEIYPNPSNGNFTLELEEGTDQIITVYNAVGNIVLTKQVAGGGNVPMNISGKGIYLVKVTSGTKSSVKRVVIK